MTTQRVRAMDEGFEQELERFERELVQIEEELDTHDLERLRGPEEQMRIHVLMHRYERTHSRYLSLLERFTY